MLKGILGRKVGMTQIFSETGKRIPVTVVEIGPVTVVQVKTMERDGYEAVQVGYDEITKAHRVNKPQKGHFKDVAPHRVLREFEANDDTPVSEISVGQVIDLSIFEQGMKVSVSGISKGKGFQGVIKRYGFKGGPASHGSRFHRQPGSIGNRTFPGRVFPGKKMPGHMGAKRITTKNLPIEQIIPEKNIILIRGAIPSHNGAVVEIHKPV